MANDTSEAVAKAVKKVEELSLDKESRFEYEMRMKVCRIIILLFIMQKPKVIKEGIEKGIKYVE